MYTADNTNHPITFRGKSTDTRPTKWGNIELRNGDICLEMDTAKVYFYDEEIKDWIIPV